MENKINQSSQDIDVQKKSKFNLESFSFMIFFVFAMYFVSTMSNAVPNLIQKVLIGIWLLIFIGILHKNEKFNLFEDNFPIEESTKLTLLQKILIVILSILSPSLVAIVTALIWHKKNPFKARRANVIAMAVFIVAFGTGLLIGFMQYR